MQRLLGLLVLTIGLIVPAAAQQVFVVDESIESKHQEIGQYFTIWKDSTHQMGLDGVSRLAFQKNFQKPKSLTLGRQTDIIWIKLQVYNPRKVPLRIAFQNVYLDSLLLYQPWAATPPQKILLNGDAVVFRQRLVKEILPSFDLIPHPKQDTTTYYFQIKSVSRVQISAQLGTVDSLRNYYYSKYIIEALIYGALLTIILYNLFIYLSTRLSIYAVYLLSTLVNILNYIDSGGYSVLLIYGEWRNLWTIILHGSVSEFALIFSLSYLKIRDYSRYFYYFFVISIILNTILLLVLCVDNSVFYQNFIQLLGAVVGPVLPIAAIYVYLRGNIAARYFIFGWVAYLSFVLVYYLKLYGIIESSIFSEYAIQIGTLTEAFIFSIALADMLNVMRIQKNQMQQELLNSELALQTNIKNQNKLLEETVFEKTQALQNETQALKETTSKLQEADTLKNKLFSIIAHDLRSPLNTLTGLLELTRLESNLSAEDLKKILAQLDQNVKNNIDLLENLLTWSGMQLNQDKILVQKELFPLLGIVENIMALNLPKAQLKDIQIQVHIPPDLMMEADKQLMDLILRNLLQNAIKFSPKQTTIAIRATSLENNRVEIQIEDQGVGITPEKLPHIFDLNIDKSTRGTALEGGSGLGLFLVRESVLAQGGSIQVISLPKQGTKFILTI